MDSKLNKDIFPMFISMFMFMCMHMFMVILSNVKENWEKNPEGSGLLQTKPRTFNCVINPWPICDDKIDHFVLFFINCNW